MSALEKCLRNDFESSFQEGSGFDCGGLIDWFRGNLPLGSSDHPNALIPTDLEQIIKTGDINSLENLINNHGAYFRGRVIDMLENIDNNTN